MKRLMDLVLAVMFMTCLCASPAVHAADAPATGYDGPKEKLHVYLLIGGSTMAGEAEPLAEASQALDRCYLLNDQGVWEPAKGAMNRYSSIKSEREQKLGPALGFARAMLEANKDISLGLVVNATDNTQSGEWGMKTKAYREARRRTKLATRTGTLKGVLWHQDGPTLDAAMIDLDFLKTLIADFRGDQRALNLPFVVGESPGDTALNAQFAALWAEVHATGVASVQGLKANDKQKLDPAGIDKLGRRYAEQMLKIQSDFANRGPRAPAKEQRIFDVHVHSTPVASKGLESLDDWMKRNGVARCIDHPLQQARPKTDAEREQMLANYARYKGRIQRFCILKHDEVTTYEQAVEILSREKADGAVGFGEHYGEGLMFDDPKNMRLLAACEKVGLPVMFHIDRSKNMDEKGLPRLERALKAFPKLVFIAHADFWLHLPDGTCDRLLREYPNLYGDVSGLRIANMLNRDRGYSREFLTRHADRILFASDAGWWSFGAGESDRELQFQLFEELDLPDAVKQKIYYSNAERLFGADARAPAN